MDMLKRFFSGKNNLFNGLKISEYPEIIDKCQGGVSTIFLTLKDVKGESFDEMRFRFKEALVTALEPFKDLLDVKFESIFGDTNNVFPFVTNKPALNTHQK